MEKMKKTYSFLFAAVALFAAASCQDELISNETPAVQGERFTVTAAADAQTKTALTDEGLNSVWTPGDAIAVIDFIGNGAEFTTDITENAASAKFTCENFNTGGLTDISALPIVALYPYQDGLTCSIQSQLNQTGDNTIKGITFPHEQTAVAGSFDKSAAFTWAMATGATKDNLVFNNLYSLLKVKVTEENITSITVSATSGSLAGKVTLPITQSGAELTVVDGQGQSSVTLTCEDGFDTEKYYYICVLPGTYEGFSIALNETVVKTKPTAAVFEAATVYPLGEIAMPEPVKQDRNLQFSSEEVTVEYGDNEFEFPVLEGVKDGVEYSSSNTSVATIDLETGVVTLIAAGTTIIKATASENETYNFDSAEYTLIVEYPLSVWGIKGNFDGGNAWASLVRLKDNGSNWYVLKGVKFTGTPEFKFNKSDDTDWWIGATSTANTSLNKVAYVGGNNIKLANPGTYDIYFSAALGKFFISSDAKEPVDPEYYLTGTAVGDWTDKVKLNKINGKYIATGVTMVEGDLKIKAAGTWDESYGSGLTLSVGTDNEVWFNGGNSKVTAGTYDVEFDLRTRSLKLIKK